MKGIMTAKTKPLQKIASNVGSTLVELVAFENPKPKAAVKLISPENVEELVELLHNEAKVI
jgi:electron transfer flavoprotein beta subunit